MITVDWSHATAFLQRSLFGDELKGVAAAWHSILRVRSLLARGLIFHDIGDLINHLRALVEFPWISATVGNRRASRRTQERPAPTVAQGTYVYRSDGAARGQGSEAQVSSSYGAALFLDGHMIAHIASPLPSCTNNIAEYCGLLSCLRDAFSRNISNIEFQVDSMLVSKQVSLLWRCLSEELRPYYEQAIAISAQLRARQIHFH
eukprot:6160634-Karenia_brevis.AAC.1